MKGRLFYLFVALLVLVILSPFLRASDLGRIILYALIASSGLFAIYGLKLGRRAVILTLALATFSLVSGMVSLVTGGILLAAITVLVATAFYGVVIALLLRYIVKAQRVTADILYGSVSVYLLIGMLYAMIYTFLDILNPAAFASTAATTGPTEGALSYYSFVTLTTLGYGDITPLSNYARTIALLEAMTGTFYVAVLVSRLVSLYITQPTQTKNT